LQFLIIFVPSGRIKRATAAPGNTRHQGRTQEPKHKGREKKKTRLGKTIQGKARGKTRNAMQGKTKKEANAGQDSDIAIPTRNPI
jgi:hypothetical protein